MKLHYKLSQPVDYVFDYLTDMQKFVTVHPVISRIEHTGGNNYLFFETLRLGFIKYAFTYHASIISDKENHKIIMTATVMKIHVFQMSFHIYEDNAKTIADEEIHIRTIFFLRPIMRAIFRKQHATLFRNIENAG